MANFDQNITELDIDLLQPNPLQARGLINTDSLGELVSSIQEHGILEPLVIARTPAGYQIIAGERRWRAAKAAGFRKVPVVIREATTRGMLEMALVENVQREDLNPIERGQAFQRLVDEFGLPVCEVAKRIGKSPSYISNTIRLLSLPDAIKDGLISGTTTEGHARALSSLSDPKLMVDAYKMILAESASVRRTEELTRRIKQKMNAGKVRGVVSRIHSEEIDKMAEEIARAFEAKTKITQSKVLLRVLIDVRGNFEKTTAILKKIHERLTS